MKSEIWIADELSFCRKKLKEFYTKHPEVDHEPILETKIDVLKMILEEEIYNEEQVEFKHHTEKPKLTEVARQCLSE